MSKQNLIPIASNFEQVKLDYMSWPSLNGCIDTHIVDDLTEVFRFFRNRLQDVATAAGVAYRTDVKYSWGTGKYHDDATAERISALPCPPRPCVDNAIDSVTYDGPYLERITAPATRQRDFQPGPEPN